MSAVTRKSEYFVADCGAPLLGPLPRRDLSMLVERVFPVLRKLVSLGYFSLEIEGEENVPRSGPAVYVGNHAGWFTLDTLLGAVAIADHIGADRLPWGAVQDQLLKAPKLGRFFERMGGFPASWLRSPQRIPQEMEIFSIYPEGVDGNCKSFLQAYQMRPWRTGFVRLAAVRRAPIVPVSILGGEECLPVAFPVKMLKPLLGTVLPLPLTLLPLPSRWKFIFHRPVYLNDLELLTDEDQKRLKRRAQQIADEMRGIVQSTLDRETQRHSLVRVSKLLKQSLTSTEIHRKGLFTHRQTTASA